MAGGRPSKLTPELVEQAHAIAADGLPVALIANQLGIHRATLSTWIKNADDKGEDSLEYQIREAIYSADAENCRTLMTGLQASAGNGNPWSATWLLTHHPRLRDHFSDAAAERKVERRTMSAVVDAITAAGLPPDLERTLLLQLQARGLGAQPQGQEGEA